MIFQMHHEDVQDPTKNDFVAQSGDLQNYEEAYEWGQGVMERHPLPEGKRWMVCDQTSSCFVKMRVLNPENS